MSSTSAPLDPQASQPWIDKAQSLLDAPHLNLAEAQAWPRDAAKAGAPLSREPLAALKVRLAERVQAIEDLQHRAQVEREAAVLLVQRIESLSTKPWREAQAGSEGLGTDVTRWQTEAGALLLAPEWPSVAQGADVTGTVGTAGAGSRIAAQLEAARAQLGLVWEAFDAALAQARLAAEDASVPLPQVPVWAEELRQGRGESSPDGAATEVAPAGVPGAPVSAAQARQNDPARLELIAKAEGLLQGEGQAPAGRKLQEALRDLREQWKKLDLGMGAPHPSLWKRFDDACSAAHKVVQVWLDKLKAESAEHKAKRLALIDELKQWTAAHAGGGEATGANSDVRTDWKAYNRELHQFGERWREAGHLSEKAFAELLSRWKTVWDAAHAPLALAQKAGMQRRQALVEEAKQLSAAHAAGAALRIDDVKALQQRWQAEAQAMSLDRRQEQKLWEAFRKPIDEAFALDAERRPARRDHAERGHRGPGEGHGERAAPRQTSNVEAMTPYDRAVFEAAQALHAASASGDAQAIQAAMTALEAARRADPKGAAPVRATAATTPGADSSATGEASADSTSDSTSPAPASEPAAPRKPVVAVRGDDRPGMRKSEPAAPAGRGDRGRPGPGRDDRRSGPRDGARGASPSSQPQPRLGDAAFYAQRDALEHAQTALKKLAVQAHGEALTKLLDAWAQRSVEQLPSTQELGRAVSSGARSLWSQALSSAAQSDGVESLLRLEMAAEVPTPAEHLTARRALQLQLLTRRNDPAPAQTWGQDVARVLSGAHTPESARRLQQALKALLRG